MAQFNRTSRHGTQTAIGFIPHQQHPDGFMMPVCVDIHDRDYQNRPYPIREFYGDGFYFALPTGGTFLVNLTPSEIKNYE